MKMGWGSMYEALIYDSNGSPLKAESVVKVEVKAGPVVEGLFPMHVPSGSRAEEEVLPELDARITMKVLVPRSPPGETTRPKTKPAGGRSPRQWRRAGQKVARMAQRGTLGSTSVGVEAVATGAVVARALDHSTS